MKIIICGSWFLQYNSINLIFTHMKFNSSKAFEFIGKSTILMLFCIWVVYSTGSWPTTPGEAGIPVEGRFWNFISKAFVDTTSSTDGTVHRAVSLKRPGWATWASVDPSWVVTFSSVAKGVAPLAWEDVATKWYVDSQVVSAAGTANISCSIYDTKVICLRWDGECERSYDFGTTWGPCLPPSFMGGSPGVCWSATFTCRTGIPSSMTSWSCGDSDNSWVCTWTSPVSCSSPSC
jgi:hypothetical protein